MNFMIDKQSAAIINNVEGDQRIHGGQHGTAATAVTVADARRAVGELRDGLATMRLDATMANEARIQLAAIEAAVRAPEPDRSRVARYLRRFTQLMVAAGSLSTAGSALIGPLRTLAGWLGSLGEPIRLALAMLG
jgi:hypothetical protein